MELYSRLLNYCHFDIILSYERTTSKTAFKMTTPRSMVSRIKLKRCEKSESSKAKTLAKISCKIGDHFVNAYINTGSSISVASTELYRKLIDDDSTFTEGKASLNVIDDTIDDQEYRMTTTTVKVIGKTKLINLVAFPNVFTPNTTLGIDFLITKSKTKSKGSEVFLVPEKPAPKPKPVRSADAMDDENEPIPLLDWILDPGNLKKPLYNILADGTAEDEDVFAICAFMKRLPRMVSPIRRLEKPSNKKLAGPSADNQTPVVPVTVPCTPSTSTSIPKGLTSNNTAATSTINYQQID